MKICKVINIYNVQGTPYSVLQVVPKYNYIAGAGCAMHITLRSTILENFSCMRCKYVEKGLEKCIPFTSITIRGSLPYLFGELNVSKS